MQVLLRLLILSGAKTLLLRITKSISDLQPFKMYFSIIHCNFINLFSENKMFSVRVVVMRHPTMRQSLNRTKKEKIPVVLILKTF